MYKPKITFIVIDLFCGAGGTTTGYHMAVDKKGKLISYVVAAINHDYLAIESHHANNPDVEHFSEDIRLLYKSVEFKRLKRLVELYRAFYPKALVVLWASLECTNFSKAKGGMSRDADSRTLAEHLAPYIHDLNPDYIKIENVVEFLDWGPMRIKAGKKHATHWDLKMEKNKKTKELQYCWEPIPELKGTHFQPWRQSILDMGYRDEWTQINSADHGAYTSRNRLFGCFAKPGLPMIFPEATHSKKVKKISKRGLQPWKAVKDKLDFTDEGTSIFGRKTDLVPNTKWRIYNGMIRHVAGGQKEFLMKTYSVSSTHHGTMPITKPAHTITTRDAHTLVAAHFISKYNGGDDWSRNTSIKDPLGVITTENRHALVSSVFISKYFSGNPWSKNTSIQDPLGTIRTVDGQAMVTSKFITQRQGGNPTSRSVSINGPARTITSTGGNQDIVFLTAYNGSGHIGGSMFSPAPTITTTDRLNVSSVKFLVNYNHSSSSNSVEGAAPTIVASDKLAVAQAHYFIDKQFGNKNDNANHQSIEQPAGTILKNDKHCLVNMVPFIYRPFSGGGTDSSVNAPAGSITGIPKLNLVQVEQSFLMPTNYTNPSKSLNEPCPVITANRKWHMLVNPQWGTNGNASVEVPCPTIIARQDKAPLSVVEIETAQGCSFVLWTDEVNPKQRVHVTDNKNIFYIVSRHDDDITKKIIEFMFLYRIVDIKMRMLHVFELKTIQGFPDDYELQGSQSDQKKFIGNSVVPLVVKAWAQALHQRLLVHNRKPRKHRDIVNEKHLKDEHNTEGLVLST